ncbi:MAG: hypothetical protein HC819_22490 [Cyclobacteriaceae bacterium]|nr:hypothetical protein [Cyclobacteriaceae bacterium]
MEKKYATRKFIRNSANEVPHSAKSKFEHSSDKEVWKAFCEEDELAFIYIYTQYFQTLLRYGWQFTHDRELVLDCIQDLFIYLRSKRSRLGELKSRIDVYLMASFRRRILDYKK